MDLRALFRYDRDTNRRLLDLLRGLPDPDDYLVSVYSHLLQAERIWLMRIRGEDALPLKVWPTFSWDEAERLIEENARGYEALLEGGEEALDRSVTYVNSKGEEFSTPVRDIVAHVLLHGAYHRGQIASAIRRSGGEPINTDYITYVRTGK